MSQDAQDAHADVYGKRCRSRAIRDYVMDFDEWFYQTMNMRLTDAEQGSGPRLTTRMKVHVASLLATAAAPSDLDNLFRIPWWSDYKWGPGLIPDISSAPSDPSPHRSL